ncbi:MAG: hypothetical protein ACJ72V_13710 [Nitrososphaeraceae archaeon]
MTKLDLDLILEQGDGRPVPKEMDRHMVKYVVWQRKAAVEKALANNDNSPFVTNRWDHSDVFYAIRTHLNRLGWDTSVYTDAVSAGSKRRKELYSMIQHVCENHFGVKRHQIGIYPADRATMAFNGKYYTIDFDGISNLMSGGTDVIVVEKFGTVVKMVPFTQSNGIAFIESQGFVSEYGIALARLCNGQRQVSKDYTSNYVSKYTGHLAVLTDCDSSGVGIGLKIPGAIRLGIDINTINEINNANPGLGLKLEDLVERTKQNSHWEALVNLCNGKGKIHNDIIKSSSYFEAIRQVNASREYLLQRPFKDGKTDITFIEYLKDNRIELNTILAAAGPRAFWNWLHCKLLQVWPNKDYRRAIFINDYKLTPTLARFVKWCQEKSKPIIANRVAEAMEGLSSVSGLIDDIHQKQQEIEDDILNNTLLNNDEIKELDKTLQKIMNEEK